jgi:hypothetical protein
MIFGFNTDVKYDNIVYHVQSEAREADLSLQTQVFVRGRCIGKRGTSYSGRATEIGFNDQQKEQILREQHRLVLDAIREGRLDDVIEQQRELPKESVPPSAAALAAAAPVPAVVADELDLRWTNADSIHSDQTLTMRLQVTQSGAPVEGAIITARFSRADAAPFYSQRVTDAGGNVEMRIEMDESLLFDSSIVVQATHTGRTATKKFQLRKVEA